MKKLILSTAAIAAMVTISWAGGNVVPPHVDVPPVVTDNWSGAYAGIQVGGVFGKATVDIPAYKTSSFDLKPDGVAGGLFAGYNWLGQNGVLFGVEADINGISADKVGDSKYTGHPETYKVKQYWDASLRLRTGKVIDDKYLPYLTLGVAWTRLGTSYNPSTYGVKKKTVSGFTIGTGVEMKLTNKVNARIQYRYTDYSKANFMHAGPSSVKYKSHMIQAGVSYKFN